MKKLLFTIESLGGGGAERILLNIIKQLDRSKFKVSLFLLYKEGVYLGDLPDDVEVLYLFRDPNDFESPIHKFTYKAYRWLLTKLLITFPFLISTLIVIKNRYDVGVSFCEGINSAILVYNSSCFNKLVGWIHIDFTIHQANIDNRYIKQYLSHFNKLVFVSNDAKAGFISTFGNFKGAIGMEVIYNPIDIDAIIDAPKDIMRSKQRLTLVAIGRLSTQKRFDKLIEAQRQLHADKVDCDVLIIGEGPERNKLQRLIDQYHLGDRVKLLGFQKNSYAWIDYADVVVMTSDYEGLPVAICEAMVLNKPIISTNVTGPRELLENGKFGMLVDNDQDSLLRGLKEIILKSELRKYYAEILKANTNSFSFNASLKKIEEVFEC